MRNIALLTGMEFGSKGFIHFLGRWPMRFIHSIQRIRDTSFVVLDYNAEML